MPGLSRIHLASSDPVIAAAPQSLAMLKQLPQACQRLGEEVPFAPRDKPDGTRYSPKASAPFPSDRLSASAAAGSSSFFVARPASPASTRSDALSKAAKSSCKGTASAESLSGDEWRA